MKDVVQPSSARADVVCQPCLTRAIKEYHRQSKANSPPKTDRHSNATKRARVGFHGGASGVFDMYSVHIHDNMLTKHTWQRNRTCVLFL